MPESGPILVVDDDPEVLAVAVGVLTARGYEVLEADNGPLALALLEEHPSIALLLTDIVMPGMNGWDLAHRAKQRRPAPAAAFCRKDSRPRLPGFTTDMTELHLT